jgi:hypothetical protein
MKIERTSIYNIYGITSKEKNLVFNALHDYIKRFGESDQVFSDLSVLIKKFEPTDDAPLMSRKGEKLAIEAALSSEQHNKAI